MTVAKRSAGRGERGRAARSARAARNAAPWAVGGLTAVVTALTMSLDLVSLPTQAQAAIMAGVTVLAGTVAWLSQRGAAGREPEPVAGPAAEGAPPAQLPPVISHFTGRDALLADLHELFADTAPRRRAKAPARTAPHVVSIHGPAGVGKSALVTRFAHEIADRYPDGQLYFDLRGGRDARVRPEEVLTGFLLALGVRLTTDPGGLADLQKLWWSWAHGKRILVFLDNARDAEQVQAIIPPEPRCAVLVTSRQPLYLRNTHDRRLHEFTESQGIELLARLAGDDRVAADLPAAVEVVELCGHLPLAISICGGRLAARASWTLREMAGRLADESRDRLDELEVAEQIDKSVRASLRLSYEDCTAAQRRLLRSFALLAAPDVQGWAAGELLGASPLEGEDLLEALVDAQLVEYSGRDATGGTRYRMHDLVRLFARERAEQEDTPERRRQAVERVIDGYRERAEQVAAARWPQDWQRQARPRPPDPGGATAMDWLGSERLALLALLGQAAELEAWTPVWRLGRAACSLFHSLRVFWQEWRDVAELTCRAARRLDDPRALGIALLERSAVLGGQGRLTEAEADAREALRLFEELRERWWTARALRAVGMTLRNAGNLDEAQRYLERAVETFREDGDQWWLARTQRNLGELWQAQRRYTEARELLEQALATFQANGNAYSYAQSLRALGEVMAAEARDLAARDRVRQAEGRFVQAAAILERAAEAFRLRHEQWEEARCLRAAGEVGDHRNGLRELAFVSRAEEMLAALGDTWGVARTRLSVGRALDRLDRKDEAVAAIESAVESFRSLEDRWWEARALRTLAEVLLGAGRAGQAVRPAGQALEIYRALGDEAGATQAQAVLDRALGVR
ncbi:ATP-binding protein [Thermomonospora cellulosilytica]|uniref:Tetratricopeptide (TPR) repeat protein n=1 Tax=Thermomonospora cellulosilytica TaxID=1411118 RepID=A0A7W3N120_9ACTN|nr:tetratricopeptide repeat protein [Thermomonospora cellulosilytica]MBA9005573.1 tetratricopeptide (TPR) repeat protein [Thermomonospora cellulosilytica]